MIVSLVKNEGQQREDGKMMLPKGALKEKSFIESVDLDVSFCLLSSNFRYALLVK
jgi:hypothetical protein